MIELLMVTSLIGVQAPTQSHQPCVWPNRCFKPEIVQVAQIQPCVWPNRCLKTEPVVAL